MPLRLPLLVAIAGSLLVASSAAQSPTVVRGRITDSLKRPVADAEVIITGGDDTRRPRTNAEGRFVAVFPDGPSTLFLVARKVGYLPTAWGATLTRQQTTITTDGVLIPSIVELPMLTAFGASGATTAERLHAVLGGSEVVLNTRRMNLRDPSDLSELLANIPGSWLSDSGVSVFGMPPGSNTTLVDGMKFDGTLLPPDAVSQVRLSTTTSDLTRNSSTGAELNIATSRGTDRLTSRMRASWMDPLLSWSDPASGSEPARFGSTSGMVAGPILTGSAHFHLSWSITDRSQESSSLLHPNLARLADLGLATDTIAALTSTMTALGIPTTLDGIDDRMRARRGSAYLTFDARPSASSGVLLSIAPSWSRNTSSGSFGYPTQGSRSTLAEHRGSLRLTSYFAGMAQTLQSAVTLHRDTRIPVVDLPSANVRVGTAFEDGRSSFTTLGFGGGSLRRSTERARWDSRNEFSGATASGNHQFLLAQSLELSWEKNQTEADRFGRYTFESLEALAANTPSSYSRILGSSDRTVRTTRLGLAVRDVFRVSYRLGLEGTLRADYARVSPSPAGNPAVMERFGYRTDQLPHPIGVSAALGFAWMFKDRVGIPSWAAWSRAEGTNIVRRVIGVGVGPGSDGVARNSGRGYRLFGAIDYGHSAIPTERYAALLDGTGLAGSRRLLSCAGQTVPTPVWNTTTDPVDACQDGSGPITFASDRPNVSLLDRDFRGATVVKGSLGISGFGLGIWAITPDAGFSLASHQSSSIDLNARNEARFTLAREAGRPVFVNPEEIDPNSGTIAPGANRLDPAFGAVRLAVADLRSKALHVGVKVNTEKALGSIPLQIEYQFLIGSSDRRGTGLADPDAVVSQRIPDPVHQVAIASIGYRVWWFTMGATLNFLSGTAYTPTVVGDVNGDGMGDRAFIPDPSDPAVDPALAAQMQSLLSAAPASAKRCLTRQLGTIAGDGSCRGDWQTRLDLRFEFAPPASFGLSDKLRITTRFIDAGGAIVRLLGMQNTALGRTPPNASIDNRLLYRTGFDPVTRQYEYRVNQLYGRPLDSGLLRSKLRPFQLEVGAEYLFGTGRPRVDSRRFGFFDDKGVVKAEEELRLILWDRFVQNPGQRVLAFRDSLNLSTDQLNRMEELTQSFRAQVDPLLVPVIQYIQKEGRDMVDAGFYQALNSALFSSGPLTLSYRDKVEAVLNAEQKARMLVATQRRLP